MSAALDPPAPKPRTTTKRLTAGQKRKAKRRTAGPRAIDPRLTEPEVGVNRTRIRNGTVREATWADHDDVNPNKRSATIISGHRATDVLHTLFFAGSIGRSQKIAGARYRNCWELGVVGQTGSATARWALPRAEGFGAGIGPSEHRAIELEKYEAAKASLGRLTDIAEAVVLGGMTLGVYAKRWRMNPSNAVGRLIAALDVLISHWERVDEPRRRDVGVGARMED
jgi:hypothetical protein